MRPILASLAFCVLLLLTCPGRAEAYLDPATGSMVLQIVIGGTLATLAAARMYWSRLRNLFRRDARAGDESGLQTSSQGQ